jgi:hypothetical protein
MKQEIKKLLIKAKKKITSNKPTSGVLEFGNENTNPENIWFNQDDIKKHSMVFGSTGRGKTKFEDREEILRKQKEELKRKFNNF